MRDHSIDTRISVRGSLDGSRAADHDQLFDGFRRYQFNAREFARLLQLRSEALDGRMGNGRWITDLSAMLTIAVDM